MQGTEVFNLPAVKFMLEGLARRGGILTMTEIGSTPVSSECIDRALEYRFPEYLHNSLRLA